MQMVNNNFMAKQNSRMARKQYSLIVLAFTAAIFATATTAASTTSSIQTSHTTSSYYRPLQFSYDPDFSMHVGSNLTQSALWGYQLFDDTMISSTEGDTRVRMMFARFGKLLIESSLASWALVAQHEIFGHGARAREFDMAVSSYHVSPFSGSTSFALGDYNNLSTIQKIALTTGGMESTTIVAYDLRDNWLRGSQLDVRAAQLYLANYLDQTTYIRGTPDSDISSGNDVASYVDLVNTWHDNADVLTKKRLRHRSLIDLFDPFLWYSVYGMVNYIVYGEQLYDYSMFNIGNYQYLPSLRIVLSPWGPEYQFSNYFKNIDNQVLYLGLRHGSTGKHSSNGCTVKQTNLFNWRDIYFDGRADLWRQPNINAISAATAKRGYGLAGFATGNYWVKQTLKLFAQLGYKTNGFLQGEPLDSGIIVRVGVTANL